MFHKKYAYLTNSFANISIEIKGFFPVQNYALFCWIHSSVVVL